MLGKKAQARRENNRRAGNLEWEAKQEDRNARQHFLWDQTEFASDSFEKADRLRSEAAELRRRQKSGS